MKNVVVLICDYIQKELPNLPTIYQDVFPDVTGLGVICRYDPSPAVDERFVDGSRHVIASFSFYARVGEGLDPAIARNTLVDIIDVLDTQEIIRIDDMVSVQCEAETLPQFVTVDNNGFTTYTCTVVVEYEEG